MPRLNAKFSDALAAKIDAYCDRHGLDRATFLRLAALGQLDRSPPAEIPSAAIGNPVGNPSLTSEKAREMAKIRHRRRRRISKPGLTSRTRQTK